MADYNPWGRAGGGAPIRHFDGTVAANLRTGKDSSSQGPAAATLSSSIAYGNSTAPAGAGVGDTLLSGLTMSLQNGNFLQSGGNGGSVDFLAGFKEQFQQPAHPNMPNAANNALYPPGQTTAAVAGTTEPSFRRGQQKAEYMTDWQREEQMKRQKAQQELQVCTLFSLQLLLVLKECYPSLVARMQDALNKQKNEREAVRAQAEARQKEEDTREYERVLKEQEQLRLKYASELENQRRKEVGFR